MKIKKAISIICVFALVLVGGYIAWKNYTPKKIDNSISMSTSVNLYDPKEVVGVKHYVFVAKVTGTRDYYSERLNYDFPDIVDYYDMPFTECEVEVIKNIKGELKENSTFCFYKVGGASALKDSIVLYEDDIMPEVGKYYIFMGMAHPDGTMTGGGTNGTIELESGIDKTNLETSAIYQTYVDAYYNQIKPLYSSNIRYLAKSDVNYNNGAANAEIYGEDLKLQLEKGNGLDEKYDEAVMSENPELKKVWEDVVNNSVSK